MLVGSEAGGLGEKELSNHETRLVGRGTGGSGNTRPLSPLAPHFTKAMNARPGRRVGTQWPSPPCEAVHQSVPATDPATSSEKTSSTRAE